MCCEPPPKGAFSQSRPSLVTLAEQGTHLWPAEDLALPTAGRTQPQLSLISARRQCKQQSWCRASHEAAPSPARAGHSGEAAQLLGLSVVRASLPVGLPNSPHTSPALGSPQVSFALSLNLSSWRMGRQVWHSTGRSPFTRIRSAALINLP